MTSVLQFPNARLFIHNLLADERVSGAEAIARGAREFGVIDANSSDVDLERAINSCDCCMAAHCVLRQYFKSKSGQDGADATESAWKTIVTRLSRYQAVSQKREAKKENVPDCAQLCSNLAPVIFDLLLQEVRRYS
jgi:hypothetical protein